MPLAIAIRLDILLFSLVKIEQASQGMQGMASRQPVALRSSASDNFSSKQLKNPETMRFSGFFLFRLFGLFWHSLTRFEPFFMG